MTTPSATPARFTSGLSTDYPWGPLAAMGVPNPFFYNVFEDDFDGGLSTLNYTATKTGAGTIATQAGDGGQILFTAAASSAAICELQAAQANFTLPTSTLPKKVFFLTRVQLSDTTNCELFTGLVNITTTVAGITDGIYFQKPSGGTTMNLIIISGSTVQSTVAIPTNVLTLYLAAATWIDLAFAINRKGSVEAFVGYPLVGWVPASAWTSSTQPPPLGKVAAYRTETSGNLTFATANLAPMLLLRTGNSTAVTMTADFLMAAKER
jgi:hypothetical protein